MRGEIHEKCKPFFFFLKTISSFIFVFIIHRKKNPLEQKKKKRFITRFCYDLKEFNLMIVSFDAFKVKNLYNLNDAILDRAEYFTVSLKEKKNKKMECEKKMFVVFFALIFLYTYSMVNVIFLFCSVKTKKTKILHILLYYKLAAEIFRKQKNNMKTTSIRSIC